MTEYRYRSVSCLFQKQIISQINECKRNVNIVSNCTYITSSVEWFNSIIQWLTTVAARKEKSTGSCISAVPSLAHAYDTYKIFNMKRNILSFPVKFILNYTYIRSIRIYFITEAIFRFWIIKHLYASTYVKIIIIVNDYLLNSVNSKVEGTEFKGNPSSNNREKLWMYLYAFY